MKNCAYCGRENDDAAIACRECGTDFPRAELPPPETPSGPAYQFPPLSAADREKDLVTLLNCRTMPEADLVVCQLRAAGIEAFLPDETLMQIIGWNLNTYGYVRVQIAPKDYDTARELLTPTE